MNKARSVPTSQPAMPGLDPERAERAARMLDRFAEMAMEQAEATHQATLAAARAGDAVAAKEFGLAFDRVGRGLRRALALQAHLARQRQEMADKAAAQARDRAGEKDRRRRQAARLVTHSIASERERPAETARLTTAQAWRRLLDDPEIDAALALAEHPVEEIVLRLCREIGIRPELVLPEDGRPPPAEPELSSIPPPNPEWWRFCRLIPTVEGRQVGEPYWWDAKLKQRVDRPPWEPEAEPDDNG